MEKAEDVRHSPQGKESYTMRKETIERVFADAKEKHAMRYTHYRGLAKIKMETLLTFAAMNLKKMVRWKKRNGILSGPSFLQFADLKISAKVYPIRNSEWGLSSV